MNHTLDNGIEITYAPAPSNLPEEAKQRYEKLIEKAEKAPKKAKKALEDLYQAYPAYPEIAHLLTYVYIRLRKIRKVEALIKETFQRHPDHLLSKINYADQCLRRKRKQEIPSLFSSTDLFELYPERKTFQISEYRGFLVLMGFYHIALGEKKRAEEFYLLACRADLTHPSIASLEKKLFPPKRFTRLKKFLRILRVLP